MTTTMNLTEEPDVSEGLEQAVTTEKSFLKRHGLDGHDTFTLLLAGLFPIAFFPPFLYDYWTARLALLTLGLPYGLICIVRLARMRDHAGIIAGATVVWLVLTSFTGVNATLSLFGSQSRSSSVIVISGFYALWAMARLASGAARRFMAPLLVATVGASALVGVLQVVVGTSAGPLASAGGLMSGLAANPVYLGPLCAAMAMICLCRLADAEGLSLWAVGVFGFALALGLTTSRVAALAGLLGMAYVVWRSPRRLSTVQLPVMMIAGLAMSPLLQSVSGSTSRSLVRSRQGNRYEIWSHDWSAFLDRPIFGWGAGNHRAAIQGYLTEDYAVRVEKVTSQPWFESHNIFVQTTVMTGAVGALLLIAFIVVSARTARGPLAIAAAVAAVSFLLQPASIMYAPIVLLLLGASMPTPPAARLEPPSAASRAGVVCAGVIGVALATTYVVGDLVLAQALENQDVDTVVSVSEVFFYDPSLADFAAVWVESTEPSDDEMIERFEEVVSREPGYAYWQNRLANRYWSVGRFDEMKTVLDTVVENEPNNRRVWVLLVLYAQSIGDAELEAEAEATACRLGAPLCQDG